MREISRSSEGEPRRDFFMRLQQRLRRGNDAEHCDRKRGRTVSEALSALRSPPRASGKGFLGSSPTFWTIRTYSRALFRSNPRKWLISLNLLFSYHLYSQQKFRLLAALQVFGRIEEEKEGRNGTGTPGLNGLSMAYMIGGFIFIRWLLNKKA